MLQTARNEDANNGEPTPNPSSIDTQLVREDSAKSTSAQVAVTSELDFEIPKSEDDNEAEEELKLLEFQWTYRHSV